MDINEIIKLWRSLSPHLTRTIPGQELPNGKHANDKHTDEEKNDRDNKDKTVIPIENYHEENDI